MRKAPAFSQFLSDELSRYLGSADGDADEIPDPAKVPLKKRKLDTSSYRLSKIAKTAETRVRDDVVALEPVPSTKISIESERAVSQGPPTLKVQREQELPSIGREQEVPRGPATPDAPRKQEAPATEEVLRVAWVPLPAPSGNQVASLYSSSLLLPLPTRYYRVQDQELNRGLEKISTH